MVVIIALMFLRFICIIVLLSIIICYCYVLFVSIVTLCRFSAEEPRAEAARALRCCAEAKKDSLGATVSTSWGVWKTGSSSNKKTNNNDGRRQGGGSENTKNQQQRRPTAAGKGGVRKDEHTHAHS